jgi:type VI secretion system lysozyme-like protein
MDASSSRPRRGLVPRLLGACAGDELAAVLANLRLLFNTRAGDSAAAPDFGVPDLADLLHQFPAASAPLQQSLQAAISRHEPRLRAVHVQAGPDHTLEFHAQLHGTPLRLRAALTASGRIDLR